MRAPLRRLLGAAALGIVLLTGACSSSAARPRAIMGTVIRHSSTALWPGFDPQSYPVAIFDGVRTTLYRHPNPPSEFTAVPGRPGEWRMAGQHKNVRANSTALIGGIHTATILLADEGNNPDIMSAAVVVHEMFHLFQAEAAPHWTANEMVLFETPFDDITLIALRRLETAALRKALGKGGSDLYRCWAARALQYRRERYALMPAASAAYEQGIELSEGLAQYIQLLVQQSHTSGTLPAAGFPPEEVRRRAYQTGTTLAHLLDRSIPGWKSQLMDDSTQTLDSLLLTVLPEPSDACAMSPCDVAEISSQAANDVIDMIASWRLARYEFINQPGWQLKIIAAPGSPLWPQGFDPLNIDRLPFGQLLHKRWLKLGNDAGSLEVLNETSMTTPAGNHPLFNGIREILLTGFELRPEIIQYADSLELRGSGINLKATGATWSESGQLISIVLP